MTLLRDGFLVLDKPAGMTSARALDEVKRRFGRQTKVGHAGTLDPFATGTLVALVGCATKLSDRVMALPKEYVADVRFGVTTATLDPESPEEPGPDVPEPPRAKLELLAGAAVGEILQKPPAFSAIKVDGRRAYDLARKGADLDLPPRAVRVYAMTVECVTWPTVTLRMTVGKGFYVRSLARDFADMLGTAGYLTALRRTRVGPFDADAATGPHGPLLPVEALV